MNYPRMRSYPIGTRVKRKNGPIMVKTDDNGKWVSEQRVIWDATHDEKLEEGDRVFFSDGDPENRNPKNLVKVRFGAVKYRFRSQSAVLFVPGYDKRVKVRV